MENPRALVHAETQHEVALATGETGLLEEPPYEWLSSLQRQYDYQFATCSIAVTYSYESREQPPPTGILFTNSSPLRRQ